MRLIWNLKLLPGTFWSRIISMSKKIEDRAWGNQINRGHQVLILLYNQSYLSIILVLDARGQYTAILKIKSWKKWETITSLSSHGIVSNFDTKWLNFSLFFPQVLELIFHPFRVTLYGIFGNRFVSECSSELFFR